MIHQDLCMLVVHLWVEYIHNIILMHNFPPNQKRLERKQSNHFFSLGFKNCSIVKSNEFRSLEVLNQNSSLMDWLMISDGTELFAFKVLVSGTFHVSFDSFWFSLSQSLARFLGSSKDLKFRFETWEFYVI